MEKQAFTDKLMSYYIKPLALRHKVDYPVPQIYALGYPGEAFKRPFIIMKSIQSEQYAYRFPKTPEDDQTPVYDFIALFRTNPFSFCRCEQSECITSCRAAPQVAYSELLYNLKVCNLRQCTPQSLHGTILDDND